jgi:hypothetical protein
MSSLSFEYSALVGVEPAKFLADFLVHQFADPFNGIKEEYVCQFSFKTRPAAERVVTWLHQAEKENLCQWNLEAEIMEEPEGSFRIAAARIKGGQMCRIKLRAPFKRPPK